MLSTLGTVINTEITLFGHELNGKVNSYTISMADLSEISALGGSKFSSILEELSNYAWVEMANLYFLARIINKTCPELQIDWFNQFMKLEEKIYERKMRRLYLESLGIIKEPRHISEPDFQMWWINFSIFCAKNREGNLNEMILNRVEQNLIKYKLIKP